MEEMGGVDLVSKKAKLILDDMMHSDETKAKPLPMPKRPYPHLALRLVLVRLLRAKDPRNACARALCVGPIHDPSLVLALERRFMAGGFHPELRYYDLKHPWSKLTHKRVPMTVYYIMVTEGLARNWFRSRICDRFGIAKRLRPLLTEEEWDTFIYNCISQHLFVYAVSAYALLWLYDNRTVDSVLDLHTGHHILQSMFNSYSCQCIQLPQDKETRLRISLPRLRHVVQVYCQREQGVVVNCAAMGCLMQRPFAETIFPVVDWENLVQFEPNPWKTHVPERTALEKERCRRQQVNAKT